jgi:hypothetical protein
VKSLSVELIQVRSRLQAAEKKANEPPPLLLTLQEELIGMKVSILFTYSIINFMDEVIYYQLPTFP